jgi:phenylpyruvate tautomerase PptA (4-oxalocrotonate tautomerase family)
MPLLKITTNQRVENQDDVCLAMSRAVASMLGKPESYVMVILQSGQTMTFAGSPEATALLELKSLGLAESQTREYSTKLCTLVSDHLAVPPGRVYIEFSSPERHMWGWDNGTFG